MENQTHHNSQSQKGRSRFSQKRQVALLNHLISSRVHYLLASSIKKNNLIDHLDATKESNNVRASEETGAAYQ
jgi:hypothetical protein